MITSHPRLLQIFNQTLGGGGMDLAVEQMRRALAINCEFRECIFQSADWARPNGPSVLRQALWTLHNPSALQEILRAHSELHADAWIVHNWNRWFRRAFTPLLLR